MGSNPYHIGSLSIHITLWSSGLAASCDKLRLLFFHYRSAYGHQTCYDGDISGGAPNHEVI